MCLQTQKGGEEMAVKSKGNFLYEILIVVLAVALLGAILYPAHVWKKEKEFESICQARMNAIYQMEIQYRFGDAQSFSDSLPMVKETVLSNMNRVEALDSLVAWGQLIPITELKKQVMAKDFPSVLREYIKNKFRDRRNLGNLAKWDDLQGKLFASLSDKIGDASDEAIDSLSSYFIWQLLVGEDNFYRLITDESIPRTVRRATNLDIQRRGKQINETRYWKSHFLPRMAEELKTVLADAQRTDVWTKDQKKEWDVVAREKWEAGLDTLSQTEKDSLWHIYQQEFWEDEKEITWMADRNAMWKAESKQWIEDNKDLWERVLSQKWEAEAKKDYFLAAKDALPDSLKPYFSTMRDSLWRSVSDSLVANDYPVWRKKNHREVDNIIRNLWETWRRVTWEEGAYRKWISDEENNPKFWERFKERLWKKEWPDMWRIEEEKLARKKAAQHQLIRAVKWIDLLGEDKIMEMVDNLTLPDSKGIWKLIRGMDEDQRGFALNSLGIGGIFRNDLIGSVNLCPVSLTPYLIDVVDTAAVPVCNITCPIIEQDTVSSVLAYDVDPVTRDTTIVPVKISFIEKVLGGREVKNHGSIIDDNKSWEKQK